MLKDLKGELSEADLAVFGVNGREDPALQQGADPGKNDVGLDALPGRDAFVREATRHVAHARRSQHRLCFALIAFDYRSADERVKGDAAKEEFLHEATARWRDVLRTEDLMGRWREEEFAIVLVNCTTVSAVQLCWRLREATPEGHSFSAGLASLHASETLDGLVKRADHYLAQAKARGQDRTVAEGLVDLD